MDAIELLRFQIRQAREWFAMTMSDVSEEQANWQPPGTANSIAATYAHTMIAADEDFNQVMAGGEQLIWSSWKDRCGLSEMPPKGEWDWQAWGKRMKMDLAAFDKYAEAVWESIEEWLNKLSPEVLSRDIDMTQFQLGMWKGLDIYNLHAHHARIHGGEIAVLKGLQGAKGWDTVGWLPSVERPTL
jgi:hypothetical protein